MPHPLKAVAFDLDAASLISLRQALPGWEIEVVAGATAASLARDWNPGAADLLVVTASEDVAETLELCRSLVSSRVVSADSRRRTAEPSGPTGSREDEAPRAEAPLLVLLPPGQEPLVRAALKAGADSCLVRPINPKDVVGVLAHARAGNQPGRHTLNLDRAQVEDRWRDDGGQG
jgi:DNA-binding NarL/FixJ family response regulator